ncbi:hypothetical protein BDE02_12G042500 [Populus trichocarpa]|nr:hypothetical protein BDE02_12G042500 [Populus trichocarpa]
MGDDSGSYCMDLISSFCCEFLGFAISSHG